MCTACPFKTSPNFRTASWSTKYRKLSQGGQAGEARVNKEDGYGGRGQEVGILKGWEAREINRENYTQQCFKYFSANRKWLREEAKKKLGAGAGNSRYGSREV